MIRKQHFHALSLLKLSPRTGMRTYFKQPHKQRNGLALQVHLQAAVELLLDVLHVLVVARPPKHPLSGRPFLPQQHQHLLVREQRLRFLE